VKLFFPGLFDLAKTHVIFIVSDPLREGKFVDGDFYVYDWEPVEVKELKSNYIITGDIKMGGFS